MDTASASALVLGWKRGQVTKFHPSFASTPSPPPWKASSNCMPEAVCDIIYCEHVKVPVGENHVAEKWEILHSQVKIKIIRRQAFRGNQ